MDRANMTQTYSVGDTGFSFTITFSGTLVRTAASTICHHVDAFNRASHEDSSLEIRFGGKSDRLSDSVEINGVHVAPDSMQELKREYKGATWGYAISDFSGKRLTCHVSANALGYRYMAGTVLDMCLLISSVKFGMPIIHASAISDDGRGILICGRGGSGKTTLALRLARQPGAKIVSDNYLFLNRMRVHSYPAPLNLFAYNIDQVLRERLSGRLRFELAAKEVLHRASCGRVKLFITPEINDVLAGKTADATDIHRMLFIVPSNGRFNATSISRDAALNFITWNQILENELYEYAFAQHAYAFNNGFIAGFWDRYRESIGAHLKGIHEFTLLRIPQGKITDDIVKAVRNEANAK